MHNVGQLVVSLSFCLNRRLSVRSALARTPEGRIATGIGGTSFANRLESSYASS